MLMKLNYLG